MPRTFLDVASAAAGSARHDVLVALRDGGPASRAELARSTGLAPGTMTSVVRQLLAEQVLREDGPAQAPAPQRSGPRGTRLVLNPELAYVLGVEVGYRTVRVLVADVAGCVRGQAEQRLGPDHTAVEGLPAISEVVAQALADAAVDAGALVGAGVALRGPVDGRHQRVSRSGELSGWEGVTAGQLEAVVGATVHLGNDADLAALGEHVFGAGRGVMSSLTVKLHSGIGLGVIVNGELVTGLHGGAGEIGHTHVDPRGPLCRCGKRGCLDTVAAVPAVLAAAAPRYGDLSVSALLDRLEEGDAGVARLVADAAGAVGEVLAAASLLLAPERIIVVGALSRAGVAVLEPIERAVHREVLPGAETRPEVMLGELGVRASALGAVALALRRSSWLGAGRT